jgi:hypothetical protein
MPCPPRCLRMISAAAVFAAGFAVAEANARCPASHIKTYNYETKASDCVRAADSRRKQGERQKRQTLQPRRVQALLQQQRQLQRDLANSQRQNSGTGRQAEIEQRRRMQEQITRQRQLFRRQILTLQQQMARQRENTRSLRRNALPPSR